MSSTSWKNVHQGMYPWETTFNKIIATTNVSALNGDTICVFSDYGGDNKESLYETISVLYVDLFASKDWEIKRQIIRRQFLADGRRMSFKNLNDRKRREALVPFLDAADEIAGICVTLAIQKKVKFLYSNKHAKDLIEKHLNISGKWKAYGFERLLRVAHLISFLVAGLSNPNQNVYWVSDEDNLFANDTKSKDMAKILSGFSGVYVKHTFGELGIGTTKIDEEDRGIEDFVSIPDLTAGAVAEITTKLSKSYSGGIPKGLASQSSLLLSPKTDLLCRWLSDHTQKLRRTVITIQDNGMNNIYVSRLRTELF